MSATQELLRFGIFELNLATEELRKSGTPVKLPPLPFKLLVLLASHAGQIVTRQEIQEQLWGAETFVDFEQSVNKCIKQIRTALNDHAEHPLYIETLPRHGYRFLAPIVSKTLAAPGPRVVQSQSGDLPRLPVLVGKGSAAAVRAGALAPSYPAAVTAAPEFEPARSAEPRSGFWRVRYTWIGAVIVLAVVIGGGIYWRMQQTPALTEKDTIVLADFDNKTGDPVFDDTLKEALDFQLEQSPFLNVLSDFKVAQTLKLMNLTGSERLTQDMAREVCLRTNSKAMLTGWIALLGSQYVIGLKAVDCNSGDVLAQSQARASGKDHVLDAMDDAAVSLRRKLGESLRSVRKYATPVAEATTPSLEALQAYSQGQKIRFAKGETTALPFYNRAVELDPNFAMAYAAIATADLKLGEVGPAAENARKAYDLREKVSERERFPIEAGYYLNATGELEKAAGVCELWQQTYPRDDTPYQDLEYIYASLGNYEKTLEEDRQAMRLEPSDQNSYSNLVAVYMDLNRLDEAEEVYKQAEERKLEGETLLAEGYRLAFLKNDTTQMAQLVTAAIGKPGTEDVLLASQADTEAWYGRLNNARELTRRAMDSAQRNNATETAAAYQAVAALREVESGNREQARADAHAAMTLSPDRDVQAMAALALARAGDVEAAERTAAKLDSTYPVDTLVQSYRLPTIRAAVALEHKDPNRAIELLRVTKTIELGQATAFNGYLGPVYLRGQAYLMLHDGNAAAAEFQKFIDYYGLVGNSPWGALARLGMARAYAEQGNTVKTRAAYQDFLALWKDADPGIPIYRQAKTEYATLQ